MNHGLDTDEQVCFYEQEFYVLSNFSSFRLLWCDQDFDTAEHAYHWTKFVDETPGLAKIRDLIRASRSAHQAFNIAQENRGHVRRDWYAVRHDVMRDILRAKADQHEYVRRKLLETGNRRLVENSWRDSYWGEGSDGTGLNHLGKLWMEIRLELAGRVGP